MGSVLLVGEAVQRLMVAWWAMKTSSERQIGDSEKQILRYVKDLSFQSLAPAQMYPVASDRRYRSLYVAWMGEALVASRAALDCEGLIHSDVSLGRKSK